MILFIFLSQKESNVDAQGKHAVLTEAVVLELHVHAKGAEVSSLILSYLKQFLV